MRSFLVCMPSGAKYWTVLGDDLAPVPEADAFLRHLRFGRDGSELTTRSYSGGIVLFPPLVCFYWQALACRS